MCPRSTMSPTRDRPERLVVGVDAGRTWVRVRAMADTRRVASLTHPVSAVRELATFLHTVWRRRGWTRTRVDALVVAARGVWLPSERRAVRHRLHRARARRARAVGARGWARAAARRRRLRVLDRPRVAPRDRRRAC